MPDPLVYLLLCNTKKQVRYWIIFQADVGIRPYDVEC